MKQLRPYQIKSIDAINSALKRGVVKMALVLPTGAGKTFTAVQAIKDMGKILWCAHTEELISQSASVLEAEMGCTVGLIKADVFDVEHKVVMCSPQTLHRRLERLSPDAFDVVVADECFPEGTLVDGNPIETIKVGDVVNSYNHNTNSIEQKKVIRLFKKETPEDLFQVKLSNGTSFICTGNHPIYIKESGYITAKDISESCCTKEMLCLYLPNGKNKKGQVYVEAVHKNNLYKLRHLQKTLCKKRFPIIKWLLLLKRMPASISIPYVPNNLQKLRYLREDLCSKTSWNKEYCILLKGSRIGRDKKGKKSYCSELPYMRYARNLNRESWTKQRTKWKAFCMHKQNLQKSVICGWSKKSYSNKNAKPCFQSRGFVSNEVQKPYVVWGQQRENDCKTNRENILIKRGEWREYQASNNASFGDRPRYGVRNTNFSCKAFIQKCSYSIQSRFGLSRSEAINRSRRKDSQVKEVDILGSQENGNTKFIRVDSCKVYKRRSGSECKEVCEKSYVYNIEVEGNHNYFVENILVHNCDLFGAVSFAKSLNYFTPKLRLGLTATFMRNDNLSLDDIFDEVIYEYAIQDAVRDGYLTKPIAIRVKTSANLDDVHTLAGDFNQKELAIKVNTPERNFMIVNKYIEYGQGRQFVAFCTDVAHTIDLCDAFKEKGIDCNYVVGDKELTTDRKGVIAGFKSGEILGLTNCNILVAGFDHPDVGCIDEETEILTPNGWKGIDDKFSKVISYNLKNKKLQTKKVLTKTINYRTESIVYKSGKYDLNVTTDHRMLIETGRIGCGFYFETAEGNLKRERIRIPVSGLCMNNKDITLTDNELRFIAWFITDGGYSRQRTVQISQSKEPTILIIRELLNDLGYQYKEYIRPNNGTFNSSKPLHSFRVAKGVKVKGFEKLRKYLKKDLAPELLKMSKRQFDIFWKELLLGDGCFQNRKGHTHQLCSADEGLVKNLQALAVMCGYYSSAITPKKKLKNGKDFWVFGIYNKKHLEIKPIEKVSKKVCIYKQQHIPKRFWCIQNENETIVVRRKGKIAIIGNCMIMAAPTKSKRRFIQQFGRGMRLKTPEFVAKFAQNVIILDVVDGTTKHKLMNCDAIDAELDLEDKLFMSDIDRQKIRDAIAKREQMMQVQNREKDEVSEMFPIPKVPKFHRSNDPATELQLKSIERFGHDIVNNTFTKCQVNDIFMSQMAAKQDVDNLTGAGYDCSKGVTMIEAKLAYLDLIERDKKKQLKTIKR